LGRELEDKRFCIELFPGFSLILTFHERNFDLLELFPNILNNWLAENKQLKFVVFLENLIITQLIKNILLV
jgi:hypothetical protein